MSEFLCFAHRGASGHEPENTLLAVERALTLGAKWIEIDVFSIEGELVVIHDERLERTTDGSGLVTESSLEYLRSLDAGKGEKIPLLSEVMDLVSGRAGLNIELKGPGTSAPVVQRAGECISRGLTSPGDLLLSSSDPQDLVVVRELEPQLRTGIIVSDRPRTDAAFASEMGVYSVHPRKDCVTPQLVIDAHARNIKVYVYTLNEREELDRFRDMGIDGFFTDYPELGKPAEV
jgi:glycerophosphoryl diester phosphodiesterase